MGSDNHWLSKSRKYEYSHIDSFTLSLLALKDRVVSMYQNHSYSRAQTRQMNTSAPNTYTQQCLLKHLEMHQSSNTEPSGNASLWSNIC